MSRQPSPAACDQPVVAVVFGEAAHHHHEGDFERRLQRGEIGRLAGRDLQHHVVQPQVGARRSPDGVT